MKKRFLAGLTAAAMAPGALTFAIPGSAAADPAAPAGQILAKFRDDNAAAGVLVRHGLRQGSGIGSTGAHLVSVPAGTELRLADALGRDPAVEYAEPDQPVTSATSDQYFPRQYALRNDGQAFTNTNGDINPCPRAPRVWDVPPAVALP
ncbi:hypothetical protein ACFFGR_10605 [Arthrobacter liuii]|uniref:Fervidolysin-like N-terminal prodomain domain-containing protein n=1 Tax=Arthrobacter liuii TaxID=1476996 RepID=A0ABQ2AVJ0_9MICC|nr:hypothetical protein [Arthrobacter liuii]GGH99013.1 hypothetical protein GCM10007170_32880 [Arthrobacter liuii]